MLRPIVNVMLGTLASDARIGSWAIERKTNADLQFLDGGRFNAWGLGGALMLDYERFSATQDIDAELRYSYMHLQSFGSSAEVVQGEASAENLGLYLRRRADGRLDAAGQPTALCAGGRILNFSASSEGRWALPV